jgi:hypothetical protein
LPVTVNHAASAATLAPTRPKHANHHLTRTSFAVEDERILVAHLARRWSR